MKAATTPTERLATPEAVLSRSDVAELGYSSRQVDAIFRRCPVQAWTKRKPMIRVADFLKARDEVTFSDGRVR
jgi:hypothetical protein